MYRTTLACVLCALLLVAAAWVSRPSPVDGAQVVQQTEDLVLLSQAGRSLAISLRCPRFRFEAAEAGGDLRPETVSGNLARDREASAVYPPITLPGGGRLHVRMRLTWSPDESLIHKWATYRVDDAPKPPLLHEVVLESLEAPGVQIPHADPAQSYPALTEGFFVGIEFPLASTRVESGRVLLAHRPGLSVQPGVWHETRKAVYGAAAPGAERAAFQRYISARRPGPHSMHVNYNSWWTSPVPYTEDDILRLMRSFERRLSRPHRVSFDTFCIDMGWSQTRSVWEIDPRLFPSGFSRIDRAARRMGARLGLWVSPSSCYPGALDNDWAAAEGYETLKLPSGRYACLGGRRYAERFRERLTEMVRRYGIRHVKFDGYVGQCSEAGHGHAPGILSAEAIGSGLIATFLALRDAAPDIWLETTCMGWDPSPWWLLYVNSVIGTFGDDAPPGRVPAPVYRESYTTGRDYFNLQGAQHLPVPTAAQEVLGIVHQTQEPFLNDAVMTVMRGHMFLPVYLNPNYMDARRWRDLAEVIRWARRNAPRLQTTEVLLPPAWQGGRCPRFTAEVPMPREPYGYAHWARDGGLVALRNPWIAPQTYALPLLKTEGLPSDATLTAVSLYPEVRVYGRDLRPGAVLPVPLAPYETLVLSVAPDAWRGRAPQAVTRVGGRLRLTNVETHVERVEFDAAGPALGPDWTSRVGDVTSAVEVKLSAVVRAAAPRAELLVLLEGKAPPTPPICRARVNGKVVAASVSGSDSGWMATGLPPPEHWLFSRIPLPPGDSRLEVDLLAGSEVPRISAWVWAARPGARRNAHHPNALPQPELISLDAVPLLAPVEAGTLPAPAAPRPRPVERIRGVFLDTMEPVSVTQGWGALRRNQSVWEKPMVVGGRRFLRGLGTHAPARIVYRLDGRFRRFQAWVGADAATAPTVGFTVRVDGRVRWRSGLMRREDAARWIDVDVRGARTLELLVDDGGNGLTADHADWADARLLY